MVQIWKLYEKFWSYSIFIDSFDAGFDQEETLRIAAKYTFTPEEIGILTTPAQPTFNNVRQRELLSIAQAMPPDVAAQEIGSLPVIARYIKRYDYYKSTYAQIKHITLEEVAGEIKSYLQNNTLLNTEYQRLSGYSEHQKKKVKAVLNTHGLTENPLEFFSRLTYWREHRKQINLMGIHLLDLVLRGIEQISGISYNYLQYLGYEEVEGVMNGQVTQERLRKRREQGVVISCGDGTYTIIEGPEAASLQAKMEHSLFGEPEEELRVNIKGNIASPGHAQGIAKIILDQNDFYKLGEGDILVTGMTRPEFVPIMKKAAAIVTNEGGITCHAAIVSRELGKPCIIGTKKGTKLIKDGDLIEVDANSGTITILTPPSTPPLSLNR